MVWWMWLVFGLLLLVLEVMTPGGFVAFFFGIAAVLVGVLAAIGLVGSLWLQVLLFSLLAVGSLLVLRKHLVQLTAARRPEFSGSMDNLVGEVARPFTDIAPGATGQAELRGTSWTVRNADRRALRGGERCQVERVEGLLLLIRAESGQGGS